MNLRHIPGPFAVAQLPPGAPLPAWADGPGLTGIIRTEDELTIICPEDRLPPNIKAQTGWAAFRSLGPFAFDETGIVQALVTPLSEAGIGVFVLCTFDGEHILYPAAQRTAAIEALTAAGHRFPAKA